METVVKEIQDEFSIKNAMAVPKLKKIVVSMGIKDALTDKKNIERAVVTLATITGQKPKVTKAKKSIATFKLREGDQIGAMVTLRGKRMYDFFVKLTSIVLPRIRDFRGVSTRSFDGKGNYSLGFSEHVVFAEIDSSKVEKAQGVEVTIVTSAPDDAQGIALLRKLGMPFKESEKLKVQSAK